MAKILYLWCGELGWELVSGIPGVNRLVSQGHKVSVCTFPASRSMYADMDVEMAPCTLKDGCRLAGKGKARGYVFPEGYSEHLTYMPADPRHSTYKGRTPALPKVLREDIPRQKEKMIAVHARRFSGSKTGRNFTEAQFNALEAFLDARFDISFIGHPKLSAACDLGTDLRTEDIGEMIAVIKRSALVFGPDSGPTHMGHWSLVPIFSWGCPDNRNVPRPNSTWNPFQMPYFHPWFDNPTRENMRKCHSAYRPTAKQLRDAIERLLDSTDNLEGLP